MSFNPIGGGPCGTGGGGGGGGGAGLGGGNDTGGAGGAGRAPNPNGLRPTSLRSGTPSRAASFNGSGSFSACSVGMATGAGEFDAAAAGIACRCEYHHTPPRSTTTTPRSTSC